MTKKQIINEIKNQHVHLFWSILSAFVADIFFPIQLAVFTGLIVGIIVEVLQYLFNDNRELKLEDRLLDLSFWFAGGFVYLLLTSMR